MSCTDTTLTSWDLYTTEEDLWKIGRKGDTPRDQLVETSGWRGRQGRAGGGFLLLTYKFP